MPLGTLLLNHKFRFLIIESMVQQQNVDFS